ncbi:protein TUNAR-like isoform X1 [Sardina pilchardus]|uniref:protein TUNAR-like isoform X1 n=1 Tax=Sardina pilchardus TaxID=27697 RepID=UPI002E156E48
MSVHSGKALLSSMSSAMFLLMLCKQIGLRGKRQTFSGKMVNTVLSDEEKGIQDKEGKEESILAMLGIIGTILNLVVIIFVYIYTTL